MFGLTFRPEGYDGEILPPESVVFLAIVLHHVAVVLDHEICQIGP
jgi:hypothetical protein